MPLSELLREAGLIMLLGMGVVFIFLGLLVGTITLMSRLVQRFETRTGIVSLTDHARPRTACAPEVVCAISIAIKTFKTRV